MICGWCEQPTANLVRCSSCGHPDPGRPWEQRGEATPTVRADVVGRPVLDPAAIRRRLSEARRVLGDTVTIERLAEHLEVSEKTVRRWQKVAG